MNEDLERTTTITVCNQTFNVRSSEDADYVSQLARYVDQRMTEVSRKTPTVDTLKVAVLTALNIADECLKIKDERDQLRHTVVQRVERLKGLLEPYVSSGQAP